MVEAGRPQSGVIGVGTVGALHAHAVQRAGGVLAAVAGSSLESSRAARDRLNASHPATEEDIIHPEDIDVVHVCVPNHLHHELALAALAAGKHVICQKPLATTLEKAQQLVEAATQTVQVTAVPFGYRCYPSVREARERFGAVRFRKGRRLADVRGHRFALVRLDEFVTGQRITAVSALATFVDGLRAAHIDAAVLASITTGDWVAVPPIAPLAAADSSRSGAAQIR